MLPSISPPHPHAAASPAGAGEAAALTVVERHQAAVRAVQFNPHSSSQHLIAAGSLDGDLSIVNLDNPGAPSIASPLPGGQRLESEITALAWNTSVPHILASSTLAGIVQVWDLKENKPWCFLRDPHRASISDIAWHPEDGLYLVTACDDDSRPVLRVSGGGGRGVLSLLLSLSFPRRSSITTAIVQPCLSPSLSSPPAGLGPAQQHHHPSVRAGGPQQGPLVRGLVPPRPQPAHQRRQGRPHLHLGHPAGQGHC